ncbi:MAG: hypothetical protein ACYTJ0_12245, partial [Planctomycetota bacterium]
WGARREMARAAEIQRQLIAMCEPDGDAAVSGVGDVPGLQQQLASLRGQIAASGRPVEVTVQPGDVASPIGDGSATHHARLAAGGVDRLGLRLVHRPGEPVSPLRVRIVGYWLPTEDPSS